MDFKKNIFLTGNPGVGKTTLIKKTIKNLENAGGFYTEEIREGGKRIGFRIITLDGKKGILAYKKKNIELGSKYQVGSYLVNLNDIEEIAVKSIISAVKGKKIVVIDEIGKMEVFSSKFREAVIEALNSPNIVIGVIHRENSGFFKKIKERGDIELIEVTIDNRNEVAKRLMNLEIFRKNLKIQEVS